MKDRMGGARARGLRAGFVAVAMVVAGGWSGRSEAIGAPRVARLSAFPVAGGCYYTDTWGAPRSGGRSHEGVDIIANEGTPVVAATDGTITKVVLDYPGSLGGNYFRLTHADGTYFTYIHLSRFASGVRLGARFSAGQTLGFVGSTGQTSVSHLHFEVHPYGGPAVNPTPFVTAAGGCRTRPGSTTPTPPTPPPTGGITKTFNPPAVVYNGTSRIGGSTITSVQVVGFPGIPGSSSIASLTITLTGASSGRAAVWPCGTNAGLDGGSRLTMTWPGAATSTTLNVKPGTNGKVCLQAESSLTALKVAVNGVG